MSSSATTKTFGLIVHQLECTAFTIAHAIASMGWRVVVFAAPELNDRAANKVFGERLSSLPGVTVELGFRPIKLDMLYIEVTRFTPRDRVAYYASRARRIGIISHTIRPTPVRNYLAQLKDIRGMVQHVLRAERYLYVDGFRSRDLYSLLGPRACVGFDVHSSFLLDPQLREKMFAQDWDAQRPRTHRLCFMGTAEPPPRTMILGEVEAVLRQHHAIATSPQQSADILWFVDAGISPERFCDLLTQCDYALCPRGWGRATHRVVEALLRGSIPILGTDELELYDLDLRPGENCVAVSSGRWGEMVLAALEENASEVLRMRANICQMREKYLMLDASNRRLSRRFGLEV